MGSKQIMIQEEVYKELDSYREKERLSSFTKAIQSLLDFRRHFSEGYGIQKSTYAWPHEMEHTEAEFRHDVNT